MKPKITRETLERLWSDPANWKYGLIYHCKEDPRIWIPKRQKWRGWTLNFAHGSSIPCLIFCILFILLPLLPLILLSAHGYRGMSIWWIVVLGNVVILSLACRYWASPDRYQ